MLGAESWVLLADGSRKQLKDVVFGDTLTTDQGNALVNVIVKHKNEWPLVATPCGLQLSMWHPVCISGRWVFPFEFFHDFLPVDNNFQFDLLLQPGKSHFYASCTSTSNLVKCVALAHGITEGVCDHPYFASTACRNDIEALANIDHTLCLDTNPWLKDATGVTNGLDASRVL